MAHELPDLPYAFNALEPYMDEQTVRIHHDKHHGGYVTKLNKALEGHPDLAAKSLNDLLAHLDKVPADIRQAVTNNGCQHANHSLYWACMAPAGKGGGGEPGGELASAIRSAFGSLDKFKETFSSTAAGQFGSGWGWLAMDGTGKLQVLSTSNEGTPLTRGHKPLLVIDVWEHAYYLKYQNRRPEFIEAWWNLVNWAAVAQRFVAAKKA